MSGNIQIIDFQKTFQEEILPQLKKEFGYKNDLAVPRVDRVILQIRIGKLITSNPQEQKRYLEEADYILSMVSGQKPKIIKARKSIAGFKLRKGMPVSLLVTLRKKRAYDFLARLLTYALPRNKEFKGLRANNFDNKGNINFSVKDVTIFPEAISDKINRIYGMDITIIGTGKNKQENIKLWELLGFPIKL